MISIYCNLLRDIMYSSRGHIQSNNSLKSENLILMAKIASKTFLINGEV